MGRESGEKYTITADDLDALRELENKLRDKGGLQRAVTDAVSTDKFIRPSNVKPVTTSLSQSAS